MPRERLFPSDPSRCIQCEHANRAGRRFCAQCGAPLPSSCSSCGFANAPGENFCGGCGDALTTSASGVALPASPRSYTPRHLADKILTTASALAGERKLVTVHGGRRHDERRGVPPTGGDPRFKAAVLKAN